MYRVQKTLEISAAHRLTLPYESGCCNQHGHNWIITVTCETEHLNAEGMVVDFQRIKQVVNALDHTDINEHIDQPTAENMARWIADRVPQCVRVDVQESTGNVATYLKEPAQ